MWSLGVIFYTLLGGYHPFHDERQPRLFRRIRDGSFMFHEELWDSTSDQAKVCDPACCIGRDERFLDSNRWFVFGVAGTIV